MRPLCTYIPHLRIRERSDNRAHKPWLETVLLNALLATLNARKSLKDKMAQGGIALPLSPPNSTGWTNSGGSVDAGGVIGVRLKPNETYYLY